MEIHAALVSFLLWGFVLAAYVFELLLWVDTLGLGALCLFPVVIIRNHCSGG